MLCEPLFIRLPEHRKRLVLKVPLKTHFSIAKYWVFPIIFNTIYTSLLPLLCSALSHLILPTHSIIAVSYTHLDVYKRQSQYHKLDKDAIQPYIYTLPNDEAVKHAFRVASGLDSMVLGEPQILGQFKQSVKIAQEAGTLGTLLHKLFQRTFEVAKEVRTNTDIGANSVSMSAAAVKLAQRIFGNISEQKVLFIGAGEMIELCADHFAAQKPKQMTIANRTLERGAALAEKIGGEAILLQELPAHFADYDIIISCTASQLPIVGLGMVERAVKTRRHRPIFMVDLGVPRDVEPEVKDLDDVFLYTVDDLAQVVQEGLGNRQQAAADAEIIVASRVEHFMHWLKKRDGIPTIKALRDQAENTRKAELDKALKLIQNCLLYTSKCGQLKCRLTGNAYVAAV